MSDYLSKTLGTENGDDDDNERLPRGTGEKQPKWEKVYISRTISSMPKYKLRSALPEGDWSAFEIEGSREVWPEPPAEDNNEVPDTDVVMTVVTYQGRQIPIRRASISLFRPDFTFPWYGKRRTGKTEGCKSMLFCVHKWYPKVFVFTGTIKDREWNHLVPERYIIDGFQAGVLQAILDKQERRVEAMRARGENDKNLWILVILDDCIAQGLRYEDLLHRLFYNGRHLYITCWITSQDTKGLPPAMCGNADVCAIYPVKQKRDKEAIREKFVDFLRNDQEFEDMTEQIQEVPFLVTFADQSHPGMRAEETIYAGRWPWYGKERPRFFVGSKSWWKGSEKQLLKYGGEEWLAAPAEAWGMYPSTYKFNWG